jgi:uncharacterized membrane protein
MKITDVVDMDQVMELYVVYDMTCRQAHARHVARVMVIGITFYYSLIELLAAITTFPYAAEYSHAHIPIRDTPSMIAKKTP